MASLDINDVFESPAAAPALPTEELVATIRSATSEADAVRAAGTGLCRHFGLSAALVYGAETDTWRIQHLAQDVYLVRPRKLAALRRWAETDGTLPMASGRGAVPAAVHGLGLMLAHETTLMVEEEPAYRLQLFADARAPAGAGLAPTARLMAELLELRLARDRARTARETVEQRFRDLAEQATGHYWETDENFRFCHLEGVKEYSLLPIGSEVLGKTRWELAGVDPASDAKWRRHLADLKAHRPIEDFEYTTNLRGNALRHWRITGRPVFAADGRFRGYRGIAVDVTAHKRAEARLLESEDRFRRFTEMTSDWLWEMDENLRYTWVSDRVLEGLSHPPDWYYGKTRAQVADPEHNPQAWRDHLETLRRREPYRDFVMRNETPIGRRWTRSNGVPVFDEAGAFKGYIGTGVDITDVVEADMAANRARSLLEHGVERLREMFALWDADDRLVISNEQFRQLNAEIPGITQPGTRFSDYISALVAGGFCPEAIGREEQWLRERLARHAEPGKPFEMQRQYDRWMLVSEHRMPEGSTVTLATDISELKRAEVKLRRAHDELERKVAERTAALEAANRSLREEVAERTRVVEALHESEAQLRLIADNLPVLITHADRDERLRFANKVAEAWFGRPSSEIVGRSVAEIFGTETRNRLAPYIKSALAGEPVRYEHVLTYPDGVSRTTQVVYVPDFDEAKAVRGYIVLAQDVTEQRASEDQLRQAQKMEAIGQLTGGIAHDFNNLLTVIRGGLELLALDLEPDSAATRHVEAALNAVSHGALLTQYLLAFARKQSLMPRPTDLNALVADFAPILQRTFGEEIEVHFTLADDLSPATVDRAQLENVILNLALNARDAMPRGGRLTIETGTDRIDEEAAAEFDEVAPGSYVTLSIGDDGHGMSADVLSHALEPFFTTKEVGKGSGLGLSMVFGFVKQSRGHMSIDSVPGAGTRVRLYLPCAEAGPA